MIWLYSVQETFGNLVENIKLREKAPDLVELQQILLAKYEEYKFTSKNNDEMKQNTALFAKSNERNSGRQNKNRKFGLKCHYCGKPNHFKKDCYIRKSDEKKKIFS